MILEVCCADIDSVRAAIRGGARRIELCSALEAGGLTPSPGLMIYAIEECHKAGVPVHVLIRPRPGDYIYSRDEIEVMTYDAWHAVRMGADGIVTGALRPDGTIDEAVTAEIMSEAIADDDRNPQVTFHRAFDLARDPFEALTAITRNPRITRILTSGQAPSAPEGADLIGELVARAPEHLVILAGAGVNAANVAALVAATGVTEIHASAKTRIPSSMTFRRDDVAMGAKGSDEYSRSATSASEVAAIIEALNTL